MQLEVRVEATPNEKRRFLGGADITPMVELVSDMLDDVMMVVVELRLAALNDRQFDTEPLSDPRNDDVDPAPGRAAP